MNVALTLALARAKTHKMTPHEIYEQRVSFIWGQLEPTDPQTRDDIKRILAEMGIMEPPKC